MATNTYVELRRETVAVATSTVTFDLTGISGYTDLEIVCNYASSNALSFLVMQLNGDTGGNYALTSASSNGSTLQSTQGANLSPNWIGYQVGCGTALGGTISTIKLLSYANSHAAKNYFAVNGNSGVSGYTGIEHIVGLWNNTAPITSITLRNNTGATFYNFAVGTTFSLYGVTAQPSAVLKATGGTIACHADGYISHSFTSSGTFTPTTSISNAEYLVIAGGGAGGVNQGGGGGAGGYRSSVVGESSGGGASAESRVNFASGTVYTVTVGAGGTGGFNNTPQAGADGIASSITGSGFTTISTVGGGGGGAASINGRAGGSGGGRGGGSTAGTGTANQGFAGNSVGGGGAGNAGVSPEGGDGLYSSITGTSVGRAGGAGYPGVTTWGAGRQNISQLASSGVVNTGSGGAPWDGTYNSGSGGSGIVVIRYLGA
jgi:hypothetical protein